MDLHTRDSNLDQCHNREIDRETGATAAEYALLIALIAAVAIGTVALLGAAAVDLYESVDWW
jgi:Flp pilus assembly pilin Flp